MFLTDSLYGLSIQHALIPKAVSLFLHFFGVVVG